MEKPFGDTQAGHVAGLFMKQAETRVALGGAEGALVVSCVNKNPPSLDHKRGSYPNMSDYKPIERELSGFIHPLLASFTGESTVGHLEPSCVPSVFHQTFGAPPNDRSEKQLAPPCTCLSSSAEARSAGCFSNKRASGPLCASPTSKVDMEMPAWTKRCWLSRKRDPKPSRAPFPLQIPLLWYAQGKRFSAKVSAWFSDQI